MVTRALSVLVVASLAFLAGGCGGDDGTGPGTGDPRLIEYAPELGIDLDLFEELPSGLFYPGRPRRRRRRGRLRSSRDRPLRRAPH